MLLNIELYLPCFYKLIRITAVSCTSYLTKTHKNKTKPNEKQTHKLMKDSDIQWNGCHQCNVIFDYNSLMLTSFITIKNWFVFIFFHTDCSRIERPEFRSRKKICASACLLSKRRKHVKTTIKYTHTHTYLKILE